jgi:hypothetical protein
VTPPIWTLSTIAPLAGTEPPLPSTEPEPPTLRPSFFAKDADMTFIDPVSKITSTGRWPLNLAFNSTPFSA